MNWYRIEGKGNGLDYGFWPGESEDEALNVMFEAADSSHVPVDRDAWLITFCPDCECYV